MAKLKTKYADHPLTPTEISEEMFTIPPASELFPAARARLYLAQKIIAEDGSESSLKWHCQTLIKNLHWRGPRVAVLGHTDPQIPTGDLAALEVLTHGDSIVAERAQILYAFARGASKDEIESPQKHIKISSAYNLIYRSRSEGWYRAVLGPQHPLIALSAEARAMARELAPYGTTSAIIVCTMMDDPHLTQTEAGARVGVSARTVERAVRLFSTKGRGDDSDDSDRMVGEVAAAV